MNRAYVFYSAVIQYRRLNICFSLRQLSTKITCFFLSWFKCEWQFSMNISKLQMMLYYNFIYLFHCFSSCFANDGCCHPCFFVVRKLDKNNIVILWCNFFTFSLFFFWMFSFFLIFLLSIIYWQECQHYKVKSNLYIV